MGLTLETDQIFKDGMTDTASYTAYGEDAASISVIFSGASEEIRTHDRGQKKVRTATVVCLTSDVASPDKRDTFTISGEVWQVDDELESHDSNSGLIRIPLILKSDWERWARQERRDL